MTPFDLSKKLTEIVSKTCNCETTFAQHDQEMTAYELGRVQFLVNHDLEELYKELFLKEIDARRRLKDKWPTRPTYTPEKEGER